MNQLLSVEQVLNCSLQQRVDAKIEALKNVEQDIPSITVVHNVKDGSVVYMSEKGLKILGVTLEELIALGVGYHLHFFNMEFAEIYVPKIYRLLEQNDDDAIVSFFQQVRSSPGKEWSWFLSCTKILLRDDDNMPLLIITNAIPMDATHYMEAAKAQRLLEENAFLNKNHDVFSELTRREKEILAMMAKGLSSVQMSQQLHISEMTAITHRRNIKRKLNAKNNYDITRFAQAFDLI